MLNIMHDLMIEHAKEPGLIFGFITYLVDGGLAILQYTYDIILLLEDKLENA